MFLDLYACNILNNIGLRLLTKYIRTVKGKTINKKSSFLSLAFVDFLHLQHWKGVHTYCLIQTVTLSLQKLNWFGRPTSRECMCQSLPSPSLLRAAETQLNPLASWGTRRHMAQVTGWTEFSLFDFWQSLSKFKPTATCRRSAPPAHCGCRPVLVSPHLVTHQCAAAEPPAVGIVKAVHQQSMSSQFPHLWYTCTECSVITNIPEPSK